MDLLYLAVTDPFKCAQNGAGTGPLYLICTSLKLNLILILASRFLKRRTHSQMVENKKR